MGDDGVSSSWGAVMRRIPRLGIDRRRRRPAASSGGAYEEALAQVRPGGSGPPSEHDDDAAVSRGPGLSSTTRPPPTCRERVRRHSGTGRGARPRPRINAAFVSAGRRRPGPADRPCDRETRADSTGLIAPPKRGHPRDQVPHAADRRTAGFISRFDLHGRRPAPPGAGHVPGSAATEGPGPATVGVSKNAESARPRMPCQAGPPRREQRMPAEREVVVPPMGLMPTAPRRSRRFRSVSSRSTAVRLRLRAETRRGWMRHPTGSPG
jgi:hypothetical protein